MTVFRWFLLLSFVVFNFASFSYSQGWEDLHPMVRLQALHNFKGFKSLWKTSRPNKFPDKFERHCLMFESPNENVHKACVYFPRDNRAIEGRDIVFHFPGYPSLADDFEWDDLQNKYFEKFTAAGRRLPIVISTVSGLFKNEMVLVDFAKGKSKIPLMDSFLFEFMPVLVQVLSPQAHLYAYGISMGSQNALQLQRRRPGIFEALILGCPAIFAVNPFNDHDVDDYLERNNLLKTSRGAILQLRWFLGTEIKWARNDLLSNFQMFFANQPFRPYMHFSIGTADTMGLFDGTQKFYGLLKNAGFNTDLTPVKDGIHCIVNLESQISSLIKHTNIGTK